MNYLGCTLKIGFQIMTRAAGLQSEDPVMQQQQSIFTGESLGASVKREKLQQRNAILRRTGFLEGPPRVKGMAGDCRLY